MPRRANIRDLDVATMTLAERSRFYAKVAEPDENGCRMWTACCSSRDGQPHVRIRNTRYQAHRVAWLLAHESETLDGRLLARSCKRPGCCEPSHAAPIVGLDGDERHRLWREANIDHVRERGRVNAKKQRERDVVGARARERAKYVPLHLRTPEEHARVLERARRRGREKPAARLAYCYTRRARKAAGVVTNEDWSAILDYFGRACAYCGRSDVPLTQDHVLALVRGGLHEPDNVVPACRSCNSSKRERGVIVMVNRDYVGKAVA